MLSMAFYINNMPNEIHNLFAYVLLSALVCVLTDKLTTCLPSTSPCYNV